MDHSERENLYRRARVALQQGFLTEASNMFSELVDACDNDARFLSYRGLLMAIRERRVCEGAAMCKRAIALASSEPEVHLNLARLYSTTGQLSNAVTTLRKAIRGGFRHRSVMKEIQRLSPRTTPPIPSLHRDHFLNDVLGKLRARLFGKRATPPKTATSRVPAVRYAGIARQRR